MATSVFILIAYLIGSLSFAVIVSRAFGLPDPHSYGSGNPGATNVLRSGRKAAALLTLIGDGAKGWIAVFLALKFGPAWGVDADGVAAVSLAVFIGHLFPVFFGFRGGKGVATALGVMLALNIWLGLSVLATWLLAAYMWRISSLSALIAATFAPFYAMLTLQTHVYIWAMLTLTLLILWRHKTNIRNLLTGREGGRERSERPQDIPPQ